MPDTVNTWIHDFPPTQALQAHSHNTHTCIKLPDSTRDAKLESCQTFNLASIVHIQLIKFGLAAAVDYCCDVDVSG